MSVVRFTPQVDSFALSHPGRRRSNNEDAYLIDRNLGLYIVCDGMGGHAAGEVASGMARELVHASLQKAMAQRVFDPEIFEERQLLRKIIAQTIFESGQRIFKAGKANPAQKGMGTTITLCLLVGTKAFLGHVGDSRCYLLRNGRTHQLTEDHTFFNEVLKNQGLEAAKKALQRIPNALSRALGAQPAVHVDTLELDLLPGDRFILCSDGLSGYLDERKVDLNAFVQEHPFQEAPNQLVHFANQMGGKDNTTVIAVDIRAEDETHNTQQIRSSMNALRHIQLFQQLDYKEHIQLFNSFQMNEYNAGEVIIRQGEEGDTLYVLTQGLVSVERDGQQIARMEPGSHFGEMSLIDNTPRYADVVAEMACTLLHISRADFGRLIHQKPQLGLKLQSNLLRSLAHIVKEQSQKLLRSDEKTPILHIDPSQMAPAPRVTPRPPGRPPGTAPPTAPPSAPRMPTPAAAWPKADELELELPTDEPAPPRRPRPNTAESAKVGERPFAETLEANPFQLVQRTNDPFAETAEVQTLRARAAASPKVPPPVATSRTPTAPNIKPFAPPKDGEK